MTTRHFSPAVFSFLRELEENNDKTWWEANKARYLEVVRDPALRFIDDLGARLEKISPHFAADTRTVGGSLMRPYRDVRFSGDKTPYKTNVGIQIRHEMGKDVHAPGYYIHLEPGSCFAGVGMWHPETAVTRRIRQAIHDDVRGWAKAAKDSEFTGTWSTEPDEDDVLKRVPREFEEDHPHAEDLKLKSFIAGARLSQKQVTSPGFDEHLAGMYATATEFTRFLCHAIGVPF